MIPIETMNIVYHNAPQVAHGPSWALLIVEYLGLQMYSIDGNILPGSALLLMFAAWGVYFWILRIWGSVEQIPVIWEKMKGDRE